MTLMKAFTRIFGRQQEELEGKAHRLVEFARMTSAAILLAPNEELFPVSKQFLSDKDYADLILTSACVGVASLQLNVRTLGTCRLGIVKIRYIIQRHLKEWDRRGIFVADSCMTDVIKENNRLKRNGHPDEFVAADSIGNWISGSLLERAPSNEQESEFARLLGTIVANQYLFCWD